MSNQIAVGWLLHQLRFQNLCVGCIRFPSCAEWMRSLRFIANLRRNENLNIACGHKYFALADDVILKEVSSLQGLVAQ